jgi:hypothetical protein
LAADGLSAADGLRGTSETLTTARAGALNERGPLSARAQRFLDDLEATSSAAARAVGGFEDIHLRVAGECVRLQFAAPALVPIIAPALSHLGEACPDPKGLTVRLWDSESTGTTMSRAPWDQDHTLAYGTVPELSGDGLWTSVQWRTDVLSVYDARRHRAFVWVSSANRLSHYEGIVPLRSLLAVWLRDRGIVLAHAAAIGTPAKCVLVVGKNGSGKSSSALACLGAGLRMLADDYCAIGPGAEPTAYSLFGTAGAHADTLARMPFLMQIARAEQRPHDRKSLLFLDRRKLLSHAPVKGVLIPHLTAGTDTVIRPATASEALATLAPSTLMQLPEASQATLSRLAAIVRSVPCHHLDAGQDPARLAGAIRSLVSA